LNRCVAPKAHTAPRQDLSVRNDPRHRSPQLSRFDRRVRLASQSPTLSLGVGQCRNRLLDPRFRFSEHRPLFPEHWVGWTTVGLEQSRRLLAPGLSQYSCPSKYLHTERELACAEIVCEAFVGWKVEGI